MQKKIFVISLVFIVVISIVGTCFGFSIDMNLDKTKDIKAENEIILTINLSEKIVGASFKLSYDNSKLKLVESKTNNLSVAENNGKIACVYVDMAKSGTDNLQIKLKATKNIENNISFNIDDAKFVSLSDETSYSGDNITGIYKDISIEYTNNTTNEGTNSNNLRHSDSNTNNTISNNSDSGTKDKVLPQTGISNNLLHGAIVLAMAIAIYSGIKLKSMQ